MVGDWSMLLHKERLRGTGLVKLGEEKAKGDLFAGFSTAVGEYREDRLRLLSEVHKSRMRGNRHEMKHGKFKLGIGE